MSIVKMKKLALAGMAEEREALLSALMREGFVQIDAAGEVKDGTGIPILARAGDGGGARYRGTKAACEAALLALKKYDKAKAGVFTPLPDRSLAELFDDAAFEKAEKSAERVLDLRDGLVRDEAEISRLRASRETFVPWADVDYPLQSDGTRTCAVALGAMPAQVEFGDFAGSVYAASDETQALDVGTDGKQRYAAVIYHRSASAPVAAALRERGFVRASFEGAQGTAAQNIARIDGEIGEKMRARDEKTAALTALVSEIPAIRLCADRCTQEIAKSDAREKLVHSTHAFLLTGWIPEADAGRLEKLLSGFCCAWETTDPAPEEYPKVPVKLKNTRLTRPLSMVTEMYSLPSYDGIDPNPLMLPFFVPFFGIMYADLGYGLILFILSTLYLKKRRPKGGTRNMFELIQECGVTTMIFGYLTGGFFGDFLPSLFTMYGWAYPRLPRALNLLFYPLLNPTTDMTKILIISMGIGVVQILTGMAIHIYMAVRDGDAWNGICDVVPWYIVFAGIALGALKGFWYVAIAGAVMVMLAGGRGKKGIMRVFGGLPDLYNISSYLGDVMSYSRLMALMLAGSVIASIVNMLGSMSGNIVAFIAFFVIGHPLNMAINIVGTYVHAARLQYLEYFGKFYKDGGIPFRPLRIDTKYVNVIEEDT